MKKFTLIFSVTLSSSVLLSCGFANPVKTTKALEQQISKQTAKGAEIKFLIKPAFSTKASSGVVKEKTFSDVKSFSVFLTTNQANPFAPGSNPFGDGFVFEVNKDLNNSTVTISDVPVGGPYYGVIAAFDDIVGSPSRNNITETNPFLQSDDNRWLVSSNSVTVNTDLTLTYSGALSSNALETSLQLQNAVPPRIEIGITPTDGNLPGTIQAF